MIHNLCCVVRLPLETDILAFIVFYCLSEVALEGDTRWHMFEKILFCPSLEFPQKDLSNYENSFTPIATGYKGGDIILPEGCTDNGCLLKITLTTICYFICRFIGWERERESECVWSFSGDENGS